MRAPKKPLTPVNQPSKWEAVSTDGRWLYRWMDEPGTPWQVEYVPAPTDQWVFYGSLLAARRATADGSALQQLVYDCEAVLSGPNHSDQARQEAGERIAVYRQALTDMGTKAA